MILEDEGVFFCGASILFLVHGLSQLIDQEEQSDEFTIDVYDQLLRMQARESNVLACLATKLRLTQQAKYTIKAAGTASNNAGLGPKPWEPLTNAYLVTSHYISINPLISHFVHVNWPKWYPEWYPATKKT